MYIVRQLIKIAQSLLKKGTGWDVNPPDPKDWDFKKLDLSAERSDFAESLSHRDKVLKVLDQKGESSCVAHAVLGAAMIEEVSQGKKPDPLSEWFAYYYARREQGKIKLSDTGTSIRACFRALQKRGCCDSKYWPKKRGRINRQPNALALMRAHARRDLKFYGIFSNKEQRLKDIMTALVNDYAVIFGTALGTGFRHPEDTNNIISKPQSNDDIIGRHAMVIIGWRWRGAKLEFEVLNSWGADWGDGGFCWLPAEYIQWRETRDLTILQDWNVK